ncbi:MAG TPA: phosphatase PAP2 family protein [Acidimicrobiales bacterium]|nr:phosphatase PAP2 family protein [Acidimicrobiales bacterium]
MSIWKEALIAAAFLVVYELTARHGAAVTSTALRHAITQVHLEQQLGLFHERTVQRWALPDLGLIEAMNLYYAVMHWVVPLGTLIWLYHRDPRRYLRWRDTAVWTTAFCIASSALFPVMPPRMLPARFGFVDTIVRVGGPGGWDSVLEKTAGNTLAAQPSVHMAWALAVALALYPLLRTWWARVLVLAHPVLTLVVVVATANHYFVDLIGGGAALAVGMGLAGVTSRVLNRDVIVRAGGRTVSQPSAAVSAATTPEPTAAGPP